MSNNMLASPGDAIRARRRIATKKVDYAKEQEFSDFSDVFEDSDDSGPARKKSNRGRPRKSDANEERYTQDDDLVKDSKPVYTERGYDPALAPIRERFPFLPEYEPDGSPRIDLIIGRRPIDEKEDTNDNDGDGGAKEDEVDDNFSDDDEDATGGPKRSSKHNSKTNNNKTTKGSPSKQDSYSGPVEYEYLIKYKGRSYLHLEWKTGADLESMNKSAKGVYRRYLKKVGSGDEELEDPNFDPSYAVPQKIIDEAQQEMTVELSDKELLKWERERAKELAAEKDNTSISSNSEKEKEDEKNEGEAEEKKEDGKMEEKEEDGKDEELGDWEDDDIDFKTISMDRLRKLVNADGPYYPVIEGSDNPYRDGYVTEPPKKARASYLFFQCSMRSYFKKRNPHASQGELMTILGDTWQAMGEEEQAPFIQLAREEVAQYEKEKAMLEKGQKANEVWQPMRRCRMVLNRIKEDTFAHVFLEPVSLDDFPDYEDVIDQPMDLGEVERRLNNRKYQAPEQFARDVRKIWNNCKIYNQHGSAIWHVADYMSKQFERLYHAWVLDFRERYIRWAHPKARPWEPTCRYCDGKCNTPDDQLVACDHCDALYGLKCLSPPLKKLPKGAWHCVDCKPRLKTVKGIRMLSAVAENAARKRAELGDTPKKTVNQTMYLVKWEGLGYEYCTWETKEDINDPKLIAEFHKLNNTYPDEPDMPESAVDKVLETTKHLNLENSGGMACIPDLRAQLYAQTRALQFSKFGKNIPGLLCSSCGPKTKAASTCKRDIPVMKPDQVTSEVVDEASKDSVTNEFTQIQYPREVLECVSSLVDAVARHDATDIQALVNSRLPLLLTGEYDAIVPITAKGLMMNVGEIHGSVAFLGYRTFPDGRKGPAEQANLIRGVGDKIVAVDGVSTIKKSFPEVIELLRESGKNKYAFMRFLETKYSVCDSSLTSVGIAGRYSIEELQKKFSSDRQRFLVQRKQELAGAQEEPHPQEDESDDSAAEDNSDDESDEGSEGEFQPDSDDDELMKDKKAKQSGFAAMAPGSTPQNGVAINSSDPGSAPKSDDIADPTSSNPAPQASGKQQDSDKITLRQETTRSLAYRLLDIDVGDSSDEGGDEDCAFYLDGVDQTFTSMVDAEESIQDEGKDAKSLKKKPKIEKKEEDLVPVKRNHFSELGERAKLAASVILAKKPPNEEDFDNFPNPSNKEIEEAKAAAEQAAFNEESASLQASSKTQKRSTVKIEQIHTATNEIVHVWSNAQAAAATLQLPLNELKRVLEGEYDEDLGDEVGGFRWRYALSGAKVTAGAETTGSRGKKGREAWLEFREKLYDPNDPHVYKNGNRLRDYQVDGVNWLASTYYKRHGCILADEMGLGKTVQIVCYIEHLYRIERIRKPYLVVVPLSTVEHWRREFEGWTDMICCVYHDRQRVWRDILREFEWYYKDRPHTSDFLKFDVLITTYDTLIGDFDVINQIPFRVAVVDEAHRLRNQKGKLLECMREISAKGTLQYGFQSRVLMSGTPLQNDLNELWTLLNFIEPFKFPDLEEFQYNFGNMANKEQVENLQRIISPYMMRRIKEDVAKDIPSKEETVIDVELTSIQKQYYRAIFEHNHAFLSMGATRTNAPKLMNIQMELRKVCNHPFLLEGVEHRETDRQFKEFLDNGDFEGKTPEEQHDMLTVQGMIMSSGKMVLLDKLLPKLRAEGHKILIFSQMVKMLDFISEYCEFRKFPHERLDGRVRGTERQKSIDRFEREKDSFLFLLSTRAGGVGINLTAADVCIIFDSDWNPQNDVQAQARCHRIGQTKDVKIFRLVTSRTFEQEMFDRASKKLGLEQAVLGTFDQGNDEDKPTSQEMEQLLKKGAYALLEDENDEEGKAFCADDIENILAKRTRTRVIEGAKTASWLNKAGAVSKSKFSSETGSSKLDMDDPLFWQKVMPDFMTPTIMQTKLDELKTEILGTPKKGPGRGRGRWRKKRQEEEAAKAAEEKKEEAKSQEEVAALGENAEKVADDVKPAGAQHAGPQVNVAKDKAPNGGKKETESKEVVDVEMEEAEETKADEEPCEGDRDATEEAGDDKENDASDENEKKHQLSRTNLRKVHKFISDLKSMMENVLEEADDDALPAIERTTCQKLLLQISVNEKLFNEQQRHYARNMLKRLEGDRRRRCRTSDQPRFTPGKNSLHDDDDGRGAIPDELRITKKQRKKRRKRSEMGDQPIRKKRKRGSDEEELDEDGYLRHSDSEGDWSDVADGEYLSEKKRNTISSKEAKRRRPWGADDDAATAAGRPWPVFPRNVVTKVLRTVLDEMMKYDESKGGVFSVPVPKDEFPEYYEQIKKPMDYGTMKEKLEREEYRSAQAMQKDFILVMQNCVRFNAPDSEIVKDARRQALMRPSILRRAAAKHNLFLSEDGSVLEIVDEEEKKAEKGGKKKRRRRKGGKVTDADDDVEVAPKKEKGRGRKRKEEEGQEGGDEGEAFTKRKPRIKIKVGKKSTEKDDGPEVGDKEVKKRRRRKKNEDPEAGCADSEMSLAIPRRKRRKPNTSENSGKHENGDSDDDHKPIAALDKPEETGEDKGKDEGDSTKENEKKGSDADGSIFMDVDYWKAESEKLNGSFMAARALFTSKGPWKLPGASSERKFRLIAKSLLVKMDKHDGYDVFAEAVSDSEAPGYSEVISNPMDFGTMRDKVESKKYGQGNEAFQKLYEDFLLTFDNCYAYNPTDGEVVQEAARILGLLPEAFASAAVAVAKRKS